MDTHDAARTGVAPFTRSGGRWGDVSGVPTVPCPPPAAQLDFQNQGATNRNATQFTPVRVPGSTAVIS
jgi:hypothetical protein